MEKCDRKGHLVGERAHGYHIGLVLIQKAFALECLCVLGILWTFIAAVMLFMFAEFPSARWRSKLFTGIALLNFMTTIWARCSYYSHFADNNTETHREIEMLVRGHTGDKWPNQRRHLRGYYKAQTEVPQLPYASQHHKYHRSLGFAEYLSSSCKISDILNVDNRWANVSQFIA